MKKNMEFTKYFSKEIKNNFRLYVLVACLFFFGIFLGAVFSSFSYETEISKAKTYLRVLINDLTGALNAIGMRDTLLKRRGQWAVDCDKLDCDYYRMLHGDMDAVNAFTGQYMVDYSWAEFTVARLHFGKQH